MFHVKHPGWGPGCLLWGSPDLEHGYLYSLVVNAHGQNLPAGAPHRFLDLRSSVGLNQKDQASPAARAQVEKAVDRKSTRLNSSHGYISYAVFCLKKKIKSTERRRDLHSS